MMIFKSFSNTQPNIDLESDSLEIMRSKVSKTRQELRNNLNVYQQETSRQQQNTPPNSNTMRSTRVISDELSKRVQEKEQKLLSQNRINRKVSSEHPLQPFRPIPSSASPLASKSLPTESKKNFTPQRVSTAPYQASKVDRSSYLESNALKREICDLQSKLGAERSRSKFLESKLNDENDSLTKQINELKRQLMNSKIDQGREKRLLQDNQNLIDQVKYLKSNLAEKSKLNLKLQTDVDGFKSDNDRLKSKFDWQLSKARSNEKNLAILRNKLDERQNDIDYLKSLITNLQNDKQGLQRNVEFLKNDLLVSKKYEQVKEVTPSTSNTIFMNEYSTTELLNLDLDNLGVQKVPQKDLNTDEKNYLLFGGSSSNNSTYDGDIDLDKTSTLDLLRSDEYLSDKDEGDTTKLLRYEIK